jgi:DME family drug/metabolite transporter
MRVRGAALVAVAAALWGTDALFRRPLAHSTGVTTIVFGEHVVLVLVFLPFLFPAVRAVMRAGWRAVAAAVAIGTGASAVATILFTEAFVHGDPVTPVVIQKVQPLVAVIGARFLLGERPRRGFVWFFVVAIAGTWLIAFPSPLNVHAHGALQPSLYALAAAVLWAMGTVLGRYLSRQLSFVHVTTLRFAAGLPAAAVALLILGAPATASFHDSVWITMLALVTGAIAVGLYYYGLRRTPAVTASLAELSFPVTAAFVGFVAFGATLTTTQWIGVATTSAVVLLLPGRETKLARVPGDAVPVPA